MLLVSSFPLYKGQSTSDVSFEPILIDSLKVYADYGYDISKIDDPVIYERQCLVEGHLPLMLKFTDTALLRNDFISIQEKQKSFNAISYQFRVLQPYEYSFQSPIYKDETVKIFDKNTSEITEYIDRIITGYETKHETRYHWMDAKDLSFSMQKDDFVVIDIMGKFKASLGHKSLDVVPEITVNSEKHQLNEFSWWETDWTYRKIVAIDHTQVMGNLNNFPVLINITDADLKDKAQSDGDDIAFVSYDDSIQYNHEIEKYTSATGKLVAWVNVTSLSSTDNTLFWMYYNNSACASQQHATATWHTNYMAVYHMGYSSGIQDSTVNNRDMTRSGSIATQTDYFISDCQNLTGDWTSTSTTFFTTDLAWFDAGDTSVTWSCWVYNRAVGFEYGGYFEPMTSATSAGYGWACYVSGVYSFGVYNNGGTASAGAGQKQWRYLTNTRNGQVINAYSNGTLKQSNTDTENDDPTGSKKIRIGAYATQGNPTYWMNTFGGWMDEYRISSVIWSDAWICTEFNSMKNGSDGGFFTLGIETIYTNDPPSFSDESPSNGAMIDDLCIHLSINITDTEGDTFNYTWGCSDGSHNLAVGNTNGTKIFMLDYGCLDCGTGYTWWINASDAHGYTNESYSFTTRPCALEYIEVIPTNNSNDICCCDAVCFSILSEGFFNYSFYVNNGSGFVHYDGQDYISSGEYCVSLCKIRFNHTYSWYVNVSQYGNQSNYNNTGVYYFMTDTYENCSNISANVSEIETIITDYFDTYSMYLDTGQLGAIITFLLFAFFMWMGFRFEEKRSSGAFVLVAGLILLASISLIYTYLLPIAILMVPVAVFISLLGLNKWLIKPNMAENKEVATTKTTK
jgi:hypothetical protein